MDAVGVAGAGQVGIVVDDEESAVGVADAAEGRSGAFDLTPSQLLLAQLDDVDAAAQRRPQQRLGVLTVRPRVADEVEARRAQALAAQRAGGLGGGEAHPPIMKLATAGRRASVVQMADACGPPAAGRAWEPRGRGSLIEVTGAREG